MQLKTCTNPDRIMKHRHKILHSMEIAFSHVLWFEKKRETDSERQMETHGVRRKRGEKRKERCRERESPHSQLEFHGGEEREQPRGFVFSLCQSSPGPEGDQETPPSNLGAWDCFPYIFLYIFWTSKFLKNKTKLYPLPALWSTT